MQFRVCVGKPAYIVRRFSRRQMHRMPNGPVPRRDVDLKLLTLLARYIRDGDGKRDVHVMRQGSISAGSWGGGMLTGAGLLAQ